MVKAVKDKKAIKKFILDNKNVIEGYGAKKLGLFGSFVRGEQTDSSDIDFLVSFHKEKKNYDNFIDLAYFLEDGLGREVELVTDKALSPYIGPYILKEVEYVIEESNGIFMPHERGGGVYFARVKGAGFG
ncbi:MAG: nucleotidyltransferase family protein [Candidatus Gracilibacteria bacterium]|nr:nucleotidyltransferase family protein [Candidatus Gracilibacteria bacterium]